MKNHLLAVALSTLVLTTACKHTPTDQTNASAPVTDTTTRPSKVVPAPDWAKNATIYEVNTRQFSAAGTFKAVEAQLPRLKELGADIIWLMPIYPSPLRDDGYDIANYREVHPQYGTLADFRTFLRETHRRRPRLQLEFDRAGLP